MLLNHVAQRNTWQHKAPPGAKCFELQFDILIALMTLMLCLYAYQVKDSFCDTYPGRVSSLRPALKECADGNVNVSFVIQLVEAWTTVQDEISYPPRRNILQEHPKVFEY